MGAEREAKQKALKMLWRLFFTKHIDLYFADEATFSMTPVLPYAWQARGKPVEVFPQRDKKVNLFRIFRPDNLAITYQSEANIKSKFLITAIDDFCRHIEKPTVLVIDNAPTHRSKLFSEQLSRWQEKDLFIFFLPKYSLHLNIAETFWRKANYEWFKASDYLSFAKYKRRIKEIFNGIGIDYKIVFKELKIQNYFA